ncbi:MAG: hypothetical protein ACOYMN_16580, partial [Roseimicrobium sp.]
MPSSTDAAPATPRPFRFDAIDFQHSSTELCAMRLGFAILLFFTIKWEATNLGVVKPEDAVGLARFVDLTFFAAIKNMLPWKLLTIAGLAAYVFGRLPVLGLLPA